VDACFRNRVHSVDATGEVNVFEASAAHDAEAKTAAIVLLLTMVSTSFRATVWRLAYVRDKAVSQS
jgi:hypothetical protein